MRKRSAFFFAFLIITTVIITFVLDCSAKEKTKVKQYRDEEIIKVTLLFSNKTVTTKTLNQLLKNEGLLLEIFFQNNLSYLDKTMEENLSHLSFFTIEDYEKSFEEKLLQYGFFDECEKISRQGVLLKKVIVLLPYRRMLTLEKMEGVKVEL